MSYRIKIPAKTLPVDEAHMLSWLDLTLHRSLDYRRPLLVGLGVLVLAAGVVGGVFYVDRQAAQQAQDLEREAMRFLTTPSINDPQKADPRAQGSDHEVSANCRSIPTNPHGTTRVVSFGEYVGPGQ